MPRNPTPAQQAAARENGKKSHRPTSEPGKRASSRNALKEGYTGAGTILPPDMQLEVEAEIEIATRHHKPQTGYEQRIVDMAALATVRIMRILRADDLHTRTRTRHATDKHDAQRAALLDSLVELLETNPAQALPQLARIAEGCDHLADAWDALHARLTNPTALPPPVPLLSEQCSPHNRQASDPITLPDLLPTARRLLGLDDEARPRQSSHAQFLADLESLAPPSGVRRLAAALDQDPGQPESPDGSSPPPDPTLLDRVQTFITTQIDLWTERGNARWQHIDGPDRDEAPDRALVDLTPEGDRLHRYLTANTRFRRQAILELEHIQRSRASATREPVARSDSTPAYSPSPRPLLPSPLAGEGQGEGSPDVPPPPTNTPAQKEPKTPQPLTIEQVLSRPDLPQPVRDRIIAHINRSQEGANGSITPKPD